MRPSAFTASRSSRSSATVASMRERENSSISSPCTTFHAPFSEVTGKLEMMPSVTP